MPEITLLMTMLPEPSSSSRLSVELPRATSIVLPLPVSLFCRVSVEPLAFRKTTLLTLFKVAPLSVTLPLVPELFPMVRVRVRTEVTSIAPIERAEVPILIPDVEAVLVF